MAGGNDFDVKIGYNKRAAATRDLTTILQDIEGVPLTDESGASLITDVLKDVPLPDAGAGAGADPPPPPPPNILLTIDPIKVLSPFEYA